MIDGDDNIISGSNKILRTLLGLFLLLGLVTPVYTGSIRADSGVVNVVKPSDIENMTVIWDNSIEHRDSVWMVRWSPNGTKLVTVGFDGNIIMWNGVTSDVLWKTRGHLTDNIRSVAWSGDGRRLATGSETGIIKIWNASNGNLTGHLSDSTLGVGYAHAGAVVALSWSIDNRYLASASGEDSELFEPFDRVVKLWQFEIKREKVDNITKGEKIYNINRVNLTEFSQKAMDVAFSPVEPLLLGVAGDSELRVYNVSKKDDIVETFPTSSTAHCFSWSNDGSKIATGTHDFKVMIFDYPNGSNISYSDPEFRRREIAWSPSDNYIAEAGSTDVIKIRSVTNGSEVRTLYASTDKNIDTGDGSETDKSPGQRCTGNYLPSLSWSPDGKYIATGFAGLNSVVVFADKIYDKIPPRLVGFSPSSTNASRNAKITVKFSEPVSYGAFESAFSYTDGLTTWDASSGILSMFQREFVFYPAQRLSANTSYFVTIDTSISDAAGNTLAGKNFWSFRTRVNTVPVLANSFVSPKTGDEDTTFRFYVKYEDLDGDEPSDISVWIGEESFPMILFNGTADNGFYTYHSTLSPGTHNFYFSAADGSIEAIGTPTSAENNVQIKVKEKKSDSVLWAAGADLVGGLIIVILIITWFKIVLKKSEKKD